MHFRASKKSSGDIYINEPVEVDKDGNALTLMDLIDDGIDIHEQVDILIRSYCSKNQNIKNSDNHNIKQQS